MHQSDQPAEPANTRRVGTTRWHRIVQVLALVLCSLALLLVGVAPIGAYLVFKGRPDNTVTSWPVGRVLRVQLDGGLYSRSLVETDSGFYSLAEGVSLGKGEAVTVEQRANQRRFLCDTRHLCTPLLQTIP